MHAGADLDDLITTLVAPPSPVPRRCGARRGIRTRDLQLYIHIPADDLEGGIATVESLGAVTVARIEDWLARHTAAGGRVRVTPVIDPARDDAVDRHDPPPWMAEQVRLTRPAVRVPVLPDPCPRLRPRPHRAVRRHRTTRSDQPAEPRPVVQATSPRQDREAMALPTHRRRLLCLDLTPRRPLPRQRHGGTLALTDH